MVGFVEALKRQSGGKNVVINFKKGTADAAWRKGAKFDYQALKKTVDKSAELTFRAVALTARGEVTEHAGKPALKVTQTNELFLLAEENKGKAGGESALDKLLAEAKSGRKVATVTGRAQEPPRAKSSQAGPTNNQPLTLIVEQFAAGASGE